MNIRAHWCCVVVVGVCVFYSAARGAESNSGWRGDGSGKYAVENPPVKWSQVSKSVEGLRFQARKPVEGDLGTPMPDGVIREWLVVGPVPLVKHGEEQVGLADEANLVPEAGQAAGELKWKSVTLDSAYVNFTKIFEKPEDDDVAGYAATNIYSPTGGPFRLHITMVGHARMWLNGKAPKGTGTRNSIDLAKGWNRLVLRLAPGEGGWYMVPVFNGRGPCEYHADGFAWHTQLPGTWEAFYGGGMGVGSPVVVGDKLFLESDPHDLICMDKNSGKVLWISRASYFEAASDEEKKLPAYASAQEIATKLDAANAAFVAGAARAQWQEKARLEGELRKQMKAVDADKYVAGLAPDVGFAGFTPCTDGKFIYAWFGDGVSACFGLDGTRRWVRVDQRKAPEHGFSSSPVLVDGKFAIFERDVIAFDCATGKPAWTTPTIDLDSFNPGSFIHGSLVAAKIGKTPVVALGNGMIIRASDGKVLHIDKGDTQSVPTAVVEGNKMLVVTNGNIPLSIRTLPAEAKEEMEVTAKKVPIDLTGFPKHYLPWHLSSPLIHDGLVYMLNNAGVLSVIDLETVKVVYQKLLDLDVFQDHNEGAARGIGISPVLAGKYIYLMGDTGTTLVIEPGRTYKQVSKNKIENVAAVNHWSERQERFVANPVFDGKRMFIRGEDGVYAIESK